MGGAIGDVLAMPSSDVDILDQILLHLSSA